MVIASSLLFASCTLKTVKPTSEIPPFMSASEMLHALKVSSEKVENIMGIMTITVLNKEDESKSAISGYVAFASPDKMSFSYIGPLGMIFFAAIRNGDKVVFYLPQQRRAYIGNIDDMKSGPLNNSFSIALFSVPAGKTYFVEHDGPISFLYGLKKVEKGWEILEKLIVDRQNMRLLEKRVFTDGVEVLRVANLEYTEIDGISIPIRISIKNFEKGEIVSEIMIGFKKVKLNKTLNPTVFETDVDDSWVMDGIENFKLPQF